MAIAIDNEQLPGLDNSAEVEVQNLLDSLGQGSWELQILNKLKDIFARRPDLFPVFQPQLVEMAKKARRQDSIRVAQDFLDEFVEPKSEPPETVGELEVGSSVQEQALFQILEEWRSKGDEFQDQVKIIQSLFPFVKPESSGAGLVRRGRFGRSDSAITPVSSPSTESAETIRVTIESNLAQLFSEPKRIEAIAEVIKRGWLLDFIGKNLTNQRNFIRQIQRFDDLVTNSNDEERSYLFTLGEIYEVKSVNGTPQEKGLTQLQDLLKAENVEIVKNLAELMRLSSANNELKREYFRLIIRPHYAGGVQVKGQELTEMLRQREKDPGESDSFALIWEQFAEQGYDQDSLFSEWVLQYPQVTQLKDGKFTLDSLEAFIRKYQSELAISQGEQMSDSSSAQYLERQYVDALFSVFFRGPFAPPECSKLAVMSEGDSQISLLFSKYPEKVREYFSENGNFTGVFFMELRKSSVNNETLRRLLQTEDLSQLTTQEQEFWNIWLSLDISENYLAEQMEGWDSIGEAEIHVAKVFQEVEQIIQEASPLTQRFALEIVAQVTEGEVNAEMLQQSLLTLEGSLPDVLKVYKLFEISYLQRNLYGQSRLSVELRGDRETSLSPALMESTEKRRIQLITQDLIKVHLDAANPSLIRYMKQLQAFESAVLALEGEEQSLDPSQEQLIDVVLEELLLIYDNSLLSRLSESPRPNLQQIPTVAEKISRMRTLFRTQENQRLSDRVVEMFFQSENVRTLDELAQRMRVNRQSADERNRETASSPITISEGDFLKGLNFDFIDDIFVSGNTAPQYIGFNLKEVQGDLTPYDADVARVQPGEAADGLAGAVERSMAAEYAKGSEFPTGGGVLILIKDRGQFVDTSNGISAPLPADKLEVFSAHRQEYPQQYGVRTGFPPTEIAAFIVQDDLRRQSEKLDRLYLYIALNEMYIPVCDKNGEVLFTPQDYEDYRLDIATIDTALESGDPAKVMDSLMRSSGLKRLLQERLELAGEEGYTLEQHTNMVLERFTTYFGGRERPLLNDKEMLLLLSTHDLGKTLSQEATGSAESQHIYTAKLTKRLFSQLGLPESSLRIIEVVTRHDILGKYLNPQNTESLQGTTKEILHQAKLLNVDPVEFLGLLKIYHQCDAGSYTEDAGGLRSLDELFIFDRSVQPPVIEYAPILADRYQSLLDSVRSSLNLE